MLNNVEEIYKLKHSHLRCAVNLERQLGYIHKPETSCWSILSVYIITCTQLSLV